MVLRRSSSPAQLVGFEQTRFRTQELDDVCSQAVAKGNLLSAVADEHCQDQWIYENLLDTYNDMIQHVMNDIMT